MITFLQELKFRNETMFYFGFICFLFAVLCLVFTKFSEQKVLGVNAWFKPFKFSLSTFFYAWAMGWFLFYLPSVNVSLFNWTIIILLGFEIIYIAIQAARGMLSHFNISSTFYSVMYSLMGIAASLVAIYTAYIGILFFLNDFLNLPLYYVWAIRLGIILFVIFAFEGFVMGSRLTHTIGGPDGEQGLPIVNWSTKYGDPRIPHFIGMHALQVLPFIAYYLLKNTMLVFVASMLYTLLAVYTLMLALNGKPLIKSKN